MQSTARGGRRLHTEDPELCLALPVAGRHPIDLADELPLVSQAHVLHGEPQPPSAVAGVQADPVGEIRALVRYARGAIAVEYALSPAAAGLSLGVMVTWGPVRGKWGQFLVLSFTRHSNPNPYLSHCVPVYIFINTGYISVLV